MQLQLFVTYAREDYPTVAEMAEVLRVGGHSVWVDDQLRPGQDWKAALAEAIRRCDAHLYVLSPPSLASEWCRWEFATAVALGKPVIPALLEADLTLPPALGALQYADLTAGLTPVATAKLMGALRLMQHVPAAEAPTAPRDPEGAPSRAFEAGHWSDVLVSATHRPQDESEQLLGKFAANLFRGMEGVGGRILVTDRRVLFEAHALNFQREPLSLDIADIAEVRLTRTAGLIPNGLTIRTRAGDEHVFVVYARNRIRDLILEQMQGSGRPGWA